MMRTTLALACLSLFVAVPSPAQDTAKPASASAQATADRPAKTIVQLVRDALNAKDFERAEVMAVAEMANSKESPISIEAFSWLARDLVSRKRYDEAMTYASRTYGIVEEHLKQRKLDDEPRLPIALGAAIEVQAQALAGQGRRSEAIDRRHDGPEGHRDGTVLFRSHAAVVGAVFRSHAHLRALRQPRDLYAAEEHRAAVQRTETGAVGCRRIRGCAPTS